MSLLKVYRHFFTTMHWILFVQIIMLRLTTLPITAVLIGILVSAAGRLAPYAPDWPHQLTAATLTAYVNKTFGPLQRCLKVAADDTAEAAAIVAMLYPQRDNNGAGGRPSDPDAHTRTIALVASDDVSVFCSAYVVIGRRLEMIDKYFDYFRSGAAERMLVVVVQNRKYIKPFIRVSLASSVLLHNFTKVTPSEIRLQLVFTTIYTYLTFV